MHLNPDHFLQTQNGRIWSMERNAWAWQQCLEALSASLTHASKDGSNLYVLIGAQGAGKSTWAKACNEREPHSVIFDAILVKREERAPILRLAAEHQVTAIAVWFQTPLDVCLARNRSRPADEIADEGGLHNVYAALEPPTKQEGFAGIWRVESHA